MVMDDDDVVDADVALAAVLVPSVVMVLTALSLTVVCTCHWRNRSELHQPQHDHTSD